MSSSVIGQGLSSGRRLKVCEQIVLSSAVSLSTIRRIRETASSSLSDPVLVEECLHPARFLAVLHLSQNVCLTKSAFVPEKKESISLLIAVSAMEMTMSHQDQEPKDNQ